MKRSESRHTFRLLIASSVFAITWPFACASGVTEVEGAGGQGGSGGDQSSSSTGSGPCSVAVDCIAFSDACNVGTCINAVCAKVPANDGVSCDDGKTCTEVDLCQAGKCTGNLKFCPSTDSCHVGMCDVETDSCIQVPGNEGQPCVDEDPCTQTGKCTSGACAPGKPTDCSFLNGQCSVGMCDSMLGCVSGPLNDGSKCEDGFFCTINDTCKTGVCSGEPNPCAAPGDVCKISSCNEIKDSCDSIPGNNGGACDDQSACTTGEICSNGACGGGLPTNDGMACNDKNACTTGEVCTNGSCASGAAVVACQNGDGCCPAACDANNDDDCGGTVYMMWMGANFGFFGYDIPTNIWTPLPLPPAPTVSQITTNGSNVLILGVDDNIYSFNPQTNQWSMAGKGPGFESSQPYGFFKWTPQGYYYSKDKQNTLKYSDGIAAWVGVPLPNDTSCAGTFDPTSGNLYIRIYSSAGVMVFNTLSNTVTQSWNSPLGVGESSRTGSFFGGSFYSRDFMTPFYKMDMANGASINTNVLPSETFTSTDVDLSEGKIYIGGYKPVGTTFQVYDTVANTISTLAPVPGQFPDSTLVVVK